MRPDAIPYMLAWLADWDHPGNPYYGCGAIKTRAFVTAIVDMVMLDAWHESGANPRANKSDFLGGTLLTKKDFIRDAVTTAYDLRAHLTLPEPDGKNR